jgi:hypothetical protein
VVPLDGDANQRRGVKGIVFALDAQDVTRTLWTSEQFAQRDRMGLFAKFNTPVIAGGKVFVATYGDDEVQRTYAPPDQRPKDFPKNYYVAVYGLLTPNVPPRPVVNQDRDDVTVMRATTAPLNLDKSQCAVIDSASLDCTNALSRVAQAPSFHRVVLAANADFNSCAMLTVITASKNSGLANSAGIGFWSAQAAGGNQAAEDSGRFIPKAQLKASGSATLLNGAAATLHEFVGVANCAISNSDSLARLFKPYMQFEGGADGKIFRNWDIASNYRISPTITQFDRSDDVLRH